MDIALYTTMYPGGEPFWIPFLESVATQTDQEFDLWIGVDNLDTSVVRRLVSDHVGVSVTLSTGGGTPAAIRCRALSEIVEGYDAVVLVDSDDILLPSRVEAARSCIAKSDVAGCALELADSQGNEQGMVFSHPPAADLSSLLPVANVFGFSNTVYRCGTLRRCLPSTNDVELMDWYTATRAWLRGAQLAFDPEVRMLYRQHDENIAGVVGPFSPERLRADIPRVLRHYELVMSSDLEGAIPERLQALAEARTHLSEYWTATQRHPERLEEHARSLNFEGSIPMWWEWVTAPVFAQ